MLLAVRKYALSAIFSLAGLAAGVVPVNAQVTAGAVGSASRIAARLTQPIDESSLVTLRGNTHPLAQARYDQGGAPASLPGGRMLLVLKRSAQQEADLKQYLDDVQLPGSASYHKFLTPEQFGALYGPADADIQTVSTWLQGHGLSVNKVNKARTVVEFSGNVAQVQEAFHTSIHSYLVKGETHYANASDPQIPAALTPVVAGVARMNNFKVRSQAVPGPRGVFDPATRTFQPEFTTARGGLYVGPSDAATIYNSPISGLNKNFSGGTVYDGTGVTIGIIGDANIDVTGVNLYRSFFGLPVNTPTVVIDGDDPGVGDIYTSDTGEALLDVEIAGGMAPGAKVNLYTSAGSALQAGLDLATLRALDDNAVSIINVSFGQCEAFLGTAGNNFYYSEWEEAAAQGISVTVSTGDSGSAGCDNPNTETVATNGVQVSGLASTPYNVAVGGTDFDTLANNFSSYVGSTNQSPYLGTANKYIPENPWNNSTQTNGAISSNSAYVDTSNNTNIVGAGGGQSSCVQSTTVGNSISCAGGYAKPSWQKALVDNGDKVRDIPDVSMFASNGFYHALWAICATGVAGGNPVNDCQVTNGQVSHITGFGGTSTASPAFAGVLAIVAQKVGGRLGQADQVLYPLAKQKPSVFHDVTTGNISVPCAAGSGDCGSNGFLTGYQASSGYDLATGIGSVDISALVNNWSSVNFTPSTTALTLNGSSTSLAIAHGTAVNIGVKVTGSGGTPTGDVSIVDSLDAGANPNNVAITQVGNGPLTLASGAVTKSFNSLPGGTYNVVAHYAGDGTFAGSDSNPVPVVVTPENSKVELTVSIYDTSLNPYTGTSIPYGFITVVDATPVGATSTSSDGNATGTVTFTAPGTNTRTAKLNSNGFGELQTVTLPAGADTISAAYSGDASFNASNASGVLTIVPAGTQTTATSSVTTIASTGTFTLSAAIATNSFGNPPTGTVTFKAGSTTLGTATLTGLAASSTALASASGSASIAASLLTTGANSITATYSGDGNYSGSNSTAVSVTVTGGGPAAATPTFSPAPGIYSSAQTVTISDNTAGATIYYTTDGSAPTVSSTPYTVPIKVSTTETLQAIAIATNFSNSAVASATYTISGTPSFTISALPFSVAHGATTGNTDAVTVTSAGGYSGMVDLTCAVTSSPAGAVDAPGCSITNATIAAGATSATATLTVSSTAATSALNYPSSPFSWYTAGATGFACIVLFGIPARRRGWRAMLVLMVFASLAALTGGCGGGSTSTTNQSPAATPTFNPAPGSYTAVQTVTITDATPGAIIHYTLDGTAPTGASSTYTAPIAVSTTKTLQAIAVASGYTTSATASGTYTITLGNPGTTPGTYTITITGHDSVTSTETATATATLTIT